MAFTGTIKLFGLVATGVGDRTAPTYSSRLTTGAVSVCLLWLHVPARLGLEDHLGGYREDWNYGESDVGDLRSGCCS